MSMDVNEHGRCGLTVYWSVRRGSIVELKYGRVSSFCECFFLGDMSQFNTG